MSVEIWICNQNRVKPRITEFYFYFPSIELEIVIMHILTTNSLKTKIKSLFATCLKGIGRNGGEALTSQNIGVNKAG
jgi:hypothetical protein